LIRIDPCITRGERAVRGDPKRLFVWETWPNVVAAHRAGAAVDPNVPELYTTADPAEQLPVLGRALTAPSGAKVIDPLMSEKFV